MGKAICVVCGNEINEGYPIKEDNMIKILRKMKITSEKWSKMGGIKGIIGRFGVSVMGTYKNNKLYVCKKHVDELKKKRKNFERNVTLITGIIAFLAFVIILQIFSGRDVFSIVLGIVFLIIIGGLLYLLSLVYYVPAFEDRIEKIKHGTRSPQEKSIKGRRKTKHKRR